MMRSLSLFTGIGGFELAAAALGCFQVEQFVEIDEDAQYVLRQHYPRIPIRSDIRTFSADPGQYDCIWGGFPCTGTSNAGNRRGLAHPDSSLWWEMLRIILEARPSFVIVENPEGLFVRGVEKSLPMSEWRDIVAKSRSYYRERKSELATKETEFLSSLSFSTLHSSNTSTNSKPAGLTKCKQSRLLLGIISPFHYLSAMGMKLMFGFPLGWTDCLSTKISLSPTLKPPVELKVESEQSEPDTYSPKQSCQDKLMLPSNECSILPKSSELSISSASKFTLSGLAISFGKMLPYLPHKTVTRRCWKDSHAQKFTNAFNQNKLVKALDKDIRYGGKEIGWCRLLCAPYKEQLAAMPDVDLQAEGGMCSSVKEFVQQYFKGDASLEVWVIRFEFIATENRDAYSASDIASNNNSSVSFTSQNIHQALLCPLGVYQINCNQINSNSATSSLIKSIHQGYTFNLGVYSNENNQIDSNYPITLIVETIHQTSVVQGGSGLVYAF